MRSAKVPYIQKHLGVESHEIDRIAQMFQDLEMRHQRALDRQTADLLAALQRQQLQTHVESEQAEKILADGHTHSSASAVSNVQAISESSVCAEVEVAMQDPPLLPRSSHSAPEVDGENFCISDHGEQMSDADRETCAFRWQWQSSAGIFKDYSDEANRRIELAFRQGHSRVRLKSGADGRTIMEIFFVDVIQRDPSSRVTGKVRRLPEMSAWDLLKRHTHALYRQCTTGQPSWESFQQYQERQDSIHWDDKNPTESLEIRLGWMSSKSLRQNSVERRESMIRFPGLDHKETIGQ